MLFIEYDVTAQGEIELVALINAVEENGDDADGAAGWPGAWTRSTTTDWVAWASLRTSSR